MELTDYMIETRSTVAYDVPAHDLAFHIHTTAAQSERLLRVLYCAIKLNGEAGEVAELIGKALRDDNGVFRSERVQLIRKELGDIMWYWARICDELGLDPEAILADNLEKLQSRKERGVIQGSGSDR